ncbi:MAG: 30S ribosomal protein S9 [bacterium]|nr:30S ribosomal protein S9 [bacterium]
MFAVGRRKSAVARVRYHKKGEGKFIVNEKPVEQYFTTQELQGIARQPLAIMGESFDGDVTVKVRGGGVRGQAESVRHGLARALLQVDKEFRAPLKKAGMLKRDARVKERKKYGLKRARRAPQWQKR